MPNLVLFEVIAKTYKQSVQKVAPNCVFFMRTHHWNQDMQQIDTFSNFWGVALFDSNFTENCLSIVSNHLEVPIKKNSLVFIPPFSIVKWNVSKSKIQWSSFLIKNRANLKLPTAVSVYPWDDAELHNENQILSFLQEAAPSRSIPQEIKFNIVASSLKRWIDKHFQDSIKLSDYASKEGVSSSYLTKSFKLCYGLTPQLYLSKLRSFEGMFCLLSEGHDIGQLSSGLGFKDSSAFYKNFSREFLAKPMEYKLRP